MLKNTCAISCALAVIFLTRQMALAQQNPPDSSGKTCEAFVKEFYSWYLSTDRAAGPHGVWPLELTIKAKPAVLSPELVSGLRAVDAASQKNQDPGLDFDPVLNTQDSGGPGDPPYLVHDVKEEGGICRADVYDQWNGKTEKIVIPELRSEKGRWIFTNFRYPNSQYPESGNLVSMIKSYLRISTSPRSPDVGAGPQKPSH